MTENGVFQVGQRYRYLLDKENKIIVIFPSDEYGNTVSRKCFGNRELPLIDIRRKEIREIVSKADYLEMELLSDSIVIHVFITDDVSMDEEENEVPVISFEVPNSTLHQFDSILGELLYEQDLLKSDTNIRNDLERVFSVISLFSGCGALDYPFHEDNNFKIIFANEINQAAASSYRVNIQENIFCMDIREVKDMDIPPGDVAIAGILCTPYAETNRSKKRFKKHKDYELLEQYIRNVQIANPYIFVIENVPAFISEQSGCLSLLRQNMPEYALSYRVLCDSDLGGYTNRKRLILFGSRIGKIRIPCLEIFPKRTVKEAFIKVSKEWYNFNDITVPKDSTKERMKFVSQGGNYRDMPENLRNGSVHSNIFRRLHPDFPSPTLCNWRKVNLMHPCEDRTLSVAESSSLMGNSKKFRFLGTLGERQQQCGNSVPQSMAVFIKALTKNALMKYHGVKLCYGGV
jgi:DNA (cytosine-5)-methyltransferase 1